jgi:HEPN domain-containing protein
MTAKPLPAGFISQQAEVARLIAEAVAAERIYLLGCSISHLRTESIFAYNHPTCKNVSHYYMLVLVNTNDTDSCNTLQDKIENHCRSFIPVTAIVLNIERFIEWINEGHLFANTVCKVAECIHDAGNVTLALTTATDEQETIKTNETYWTQGINKVNEFLAGAELYRIRKQNKMAAFMLHQAAEHALHTIFKKATGLHVNTHNIDKLIRYCSMVNYKLPAVFPRNNEKNERLFGLLQRAYIDTRYKEDFTITTPELLTITERIKNLQEIMQDTFH